MEKRDANRIEFSTEAEVISDNVTLKGEVDNLSLKGVFIKIGKAIPAGSDVDVKIHLSGSTTDLFVKLKGTVARSDDNGVAVEFQEMELDSFIHLKNIVNYADMSINDAKKNTESLD